jgi:hypothetical protein
MTCSEIIDIRTEMVAINEIEKTNASNQTLHNGERILTSSIMISPHPMMIQRPTFGGGTEERSPVIDSFEIVAELC